VLEQTKPGVVGLPDVRVRLRAGPDAEWEEVGWSDVLRASRVGPGIEELPPPEPPAWRAWLRRGLIGAAVAGALAALWWVARRARLVRAGPAPADVHALRQLERLGQSAEGLSPADFHGQLAEVVRTYLAARYGLHGAHQTTSEFLTALADVPGLMKDQRDLLTLLFERCDLAKFAAVPATPVQCRELAELAARLVRATAPVGQATPANRAGEFAGASPG
jgi:hypothetical protein